MKLRLLFCLVVAGATCIGPIVSGSTTSPSAARAGADARAGLSKAMKAMLAARSYRARVESSTSSGTTSTTLVEFASPDHFHLTREVTVAGRAPRHQETIILGNDTWMKMGETPWQKFPLNLGDLITQFRDPKILEQIARSIDVKVIGAEALDGSQTTIYGYTLTDSDNRQSDITARTWVGVADSLPRKTESESDGNLGGRQIHIKGTVTYYDYEADIKIERPL